MSVNVKLGNDIINGIDTIKLQDATTSGLYHNFSLLNPNIYYNSSVAPSDTNMLWVKTNTNPNKVCVSKSVDVDAPLTEQSEGVSLSSDYRSFLINGCIYFVGNTGVEIYNPITKSLTSLYRWSTRVSPGIAVVGSKIYLFGGANGTSTSATYMSSIICYDTENDSAVTKTATLSDARQSVTAVAVGTKIYAFGGYTYTSTSYKYHDRSTLECYDTETDTISTIGSISDSGFSISAYTVDSKIYLFGGGYHPTYSNPVTYAYIRCYDTITNKLTTLQEELPSNGGPNLTRIGDRLYFFKLSKLYYFDINTETITYVCDTVNSFSTIVYFSNNLYTSFSNVIYKIPMSLSLNNNNLLILDNYGASSFKLFSTNMLDATVYPKSVYLGDSNNKAQKVEAALYDYVNQTWVNI